MAQEKQSWGSWLGSAVGAVAGYVTGYDELEAVDPTQGEGGTAAAATDGRAEDRKAMFTQLKEYIGRDVMSLMSIPVWLMEPTTILQKTCENMEYYRLLDEAAAETDPAARMALVAAFAVSVYASSERTYKPFNPILGETFEVALGEGGGAVSYVAEQVSHHPPVTAAHAAAAAWTYDLTSAPKTKFMGNYIEMYPHGATRIRLTQHGETYTLKPPSSRVNNLVVGRAWVDHFGDLTLTCVETGAVAKLTYTPCGWFGAGRYEVKGAVYPEGPGAAPALAVYGKWSQGLACRACDGSGAALEGADERKLWTASGVAPGDGYGFTKFMHHLNDAASAHPGRALLPSDSRLRPDRVALQEEDSQGAQAWKTDLEERQRSERSRREAAGDAYAPKWFAPPLEGAAAAAEGEEVDGIWRWNGEYAKYCESAPPRGDAHPEFSPWCYPAP